MSKSGGRITKKSWHIKYRYGQKEVGCITSVTELDQKGQAMNSSLCFCVCIEPTIPLHVNRYWGSLGK